MNQQHTIIRFLIGSVVATAVVVAIVASVRISRLGRQDSGLSQEYRYDLSAMARTDPNLVLYREQGSPIPTGLKQSHALAVDAEGTIYVVGDRVIQVIRAGRVTDTVPLTVEPRCLAVTADRFYVGARDRVVILDRAGAVQAAWPSLGERAVLTALALDEEHVYLADAGQRVVWCFDHQGQELRRIGDKDPDRNIPGFSIPSPHFDLALAPDGLLRVVNPGNHRIEAYTAEGDLELGWGQFGNDVEAFTGCCNPVSMDVLPDGRVITCEKGLIRVKLYDVDGRFLGVVAGHDQLTAREAAICETPEQCQTGAWDVAVDAAGRVYVLDTQKNEIRVFTEKE
jgi:DNA-binding beta-propeller fold protein YncE